MGIDSCPLFAFFHSFCVTGAVTLVLHHNIKYNVMEHED